VNEQADAPRTADITLTHPPATPTLVLRTSSYPEARPTGLTCTPTAARLLRTTESGLRQQSSPNDNVGDGIGAREVAAALYAVNGNLDNVPGDDGERAIPEGTTHHCRRNWPKRRPRSQR